MLNKPEPEKPLGGHIIKGKGHQKNSPSICSTCGLGFTKDERIVSHRRHGNNGAFRLYYHVQCWESKFVDSDCSDLEIDREIEQMQVMARKERELTEALKRTSL
ncbi:hypothetical protein MUP77_21775 [Candidatus Bathyarchaeota archaeon]|nr:hypothetical protein [Candidatus Bathyarchaeota archaeon]